jgi:hypothetical protein
MRCSEAPMLTRHSSWNTSANCASPARAWASDMNLPGYKDEHPWRQTILKIGYQEVDWTRIYFVGGGVDARYQPPSGQDAMPPSCLDAPDPATAPSPVGDESRSCRLLRFQVTTFRSWSLSRREESGGHLPVAFSIWALPPSLDLTSSPRECLPGQTPIAVGTGPRRASAASP